MSTQVVKIGKTNWLLGLHWLSSEDPPTKSMIKKEAAEEHATWYAMRIGASSIQCGYGNPPEGHRGGAIGLYSLAALLADTEQQPWLGRFKLAENLWWCLIIRDGHAILQNGDVVGDEAMMDQIRDQYAGLGGWTYINDDLDQLKARIDAITQKKTPIKSLVAPSFTRLQMAAGGVALVCAVGGYFLYQHHVAEVKKNYLMQMAIARAKLAHKAASLPPSPLTSTPTPAVWLSACQVAIEDAPLSVDGGWVLSGATCENTVVNFVWKRGPGATVANRPRGVLVDNDTVSNQTPLPPLPTGVNDAINMDDAKTQLVAKLQEIGVDLKIIPIQTAPVLPGAVAINAPVSITPSQPFSFDSPIPVFVLALNVPGLRLTKISTSDSPSDLTWHVEGVLYAR